MMEAGNTNCSSEDGVLSTSPSEDPSRHEPITYRNQWVMKGLPAWAHAGLPHGWTKTTHQSGLPMYYHRESRVVVLCKPYQLGNADLKTHKIPVTAIPCMFYDALCNQKPPPCDPAVSSTTGDDVRVFNTSKRQDSEAVELGCLSEDQLRAYCENKFKFERVSVPYFQNFSSKCKYKKGLRKLGAKVEDGDQAAESSEHIRAGGSTAKPGPSLKRPSSISEDCAAIEKKQKHFEPEAASRGNYTCQLHMLCSKKLGCCLSYESLPPLTDQPDDRYRVMAKLGNRPYCQGAGPNKKAAKMEAARKTLLAINGERGAAALQTECQTTERAEVGSAQLVRETANHVGDERGTKEEDALEEGECRSDEHESIPSYEEIDDNQAVDLVSRWEAGGAKAEGNDGGRGDQAAVDEKWWQVASCSPRISQSAIDLFSQYGINSEMIHNLCQTVSCPTPYAVLKRMIYLDAFQFRHGLQEEVSTFSGRIHVRLTCRRYNAITLEDHTKKWVIEKICGEAVSVENKEEARSGAAQKVISKMMPLLKTYTDALLLLQSWEVLVGDSNTGFSASFGKRLGPYQRDKCEGIDWHLLGEINSELRNVCGESDKPDYLFEL